MKFVYIVTYYNHLDGEWEIGNVYTDLSAALAEAEETDGIIYTREVIEKE